MKNLYLLIFLFLSTFHLSGQIERDQIEHDRDKPDYKLSYETKEILVVLDDNIGTNEVDILLEKYHAKEIWMSPLSKVRLWEVQDFGFRVDGNVINDINDVKKQLKEEEDETEVEGIGFNMKSIMNSPPENNDTNFHTDYEPIDETNYAIYGSPGNNSIRVAVFDTGYLNGVFDKAQAVVSKWDYIDNDPIPEDNHSHGTHITSIIHQVCGLDSSIEFDIRKTHNSEGKGKLSDIILAMDHAVIAGADIMNMSFSYLEIDNSLLDHPIQRAFKVARDHNVLIISSAGNDGAFMTNDYRTYPATADYPNVISVASSNNQKQKSDWSNYSRRLVDIIAPGESISGLYSKNPGVYVKRSGSSQAAAVVSGMAALIGTHLNVSSRINYRDLIIENTTSDGLNFVCHGAVDICLIQEEVNPDFICTINNRSLDPIVAIDVYPNPFTDFIQISLAKESKYTEAQLFDINGKLLMKQFVNDDFFIMETSNLYGDGVFILKLVADDNQSVRRLIKN